MEPYIIIAQAYCVLISGRIKPSRLIFFKLQKISPLLIILQQLFRKFYNIYISIYKRKPNELN